MRELIFTFHGLGEPPPGLTDAERKVWVPVEWFAEIIEALPDRGVEITFDDGNASDLEYALPLLTRAGRTARFFVLAGRIGSPGHLDEAAVIALRDAGMTIGSHGFHHRDWRRLSDSEREQELIGAKHNLSALVGGEVDQAACPFGSYDRKLLQALRAAGYRRVYTSDGGLTSPTSWLTPRTSVHRERPLSDWRALASKPRSSAAADVTRLGKRLVKRLR